MLLNIENLSFGWHETLLLEGITEQLLPGEIVQLMGANGAGKTTLLHLIAGMIPHFNRGAMLTGDIRINGRSIFQSPPKCFFPMISFISSLHLDFFLLTESLHQEIQLATAILKTASDQIQQRITEFASFFPMIRGMNDIPFKTMTLDRKILAISLIFYLHQAQLYLFDEIFPAFSEILKSQWLEFFRWLSRQGCAVIFVDHQGSANGFTKWILNERHLTRS